MASANSFEPVDSIEAPTPTPSHLEAHIAPLDSNKEFEDLHRDCSLFPAYTDYLYGPDTRLQTYSEEDSAAMEVAIQPVVSLPVTYRQAWTSPEELAVRFLDIRASTSSANTFPQPSGPSLTFGPSPDPANRVDSATPVDENSLVTVPLNILLQQSTPPVLVPGEVTGTKYQGLSDAMRETIDTRVTMAWSMLRNVGADQANLQSANRYLIRITNQVREHHRKCVLHKGAKYLWDCFKVRDSFPPDHPDYVQAQRRVYDFQEKATPAVRTYINHALKAMLKAETDGRDPIAVLEGQEIPKIISFAPQPQSTRPAHYPEATPAWNLTGLQLQGPPKDPLPNDSIAPTVPPRSPTPRSDLSGVRNSF